MDFIEINDLYYNQWLLTITEHLKRRDGCQGSDAKPAPSALDLTGTHLKVYRIFDQKNKPQNRLGCSPCPLLDWTMKNSESGIISCNACCSCSGYSTSELTPTTSTGIWRLHKRTGGGREKGNSEKNRFLADATHPHNCPCFVLFQSNRHSTHTSTQPTQSFPVSVLRLRPARGQGRGSPSPARTTYLIQVYTYTRSGLDLTLKPRTLWPRDGR